MEEKGNMLNGNGEEGATTDPLIREIQSLKKQTGAVILAHYYVDGAIREIADHVGDSYYLAKLGTQIPQQTIVLCGVTFMGESVKLLNGEKTVLMPDLTAGCPMAEMYAISEIRRLRREVDDLAVVCYVNSTLELKAHSDVCVTSSNAVKVVRSLPQQTIYFVPDENLGAFIASQVPEKTFILHDGFCCVHTKIPVAEVKRAMREYPDAPVLAHPECSPDVLALADYIGSTSGILSQAAASEARAFIICTEMGILHELRSIAPEKSFLFPGNPECTSMKKVNLEKIRHVLATRANEFVVDEAMSQAAAASLEQMMRRAGTGAQDWQ